MMHLHFKFNKVNELEFLNLLTYISSFDRTLSFKKLHQYPPENFYTHYTLPTNKKKYFPK